MLLKNGFDGKGSCICITYRGVTASSSCIVVQGFPKDASLNQLRDRLRDSFAASKLNTTFDSRYKLVAAHSTLVRFCSRLSDPAALLRLCYENRKTEFGTITFSDFELVFNDWYNRTSAKQLLAKYSCPSSDLKNISRQNSL